MTVTDQDNDLDSFWQSIPFMLEHDAGWALREVLDAGVAGYTRDKATPEGFMIRHSPDGTKELVRINIDGPDTVIRAL